MNRRRDHNPRVFYPSAGQFLPAKIQILAWIIVFAFNWIWMMDITAIDPAEDRSHTLFWNTV